MLVRALVKAGAQVQVVMTPSAHDFVTPLTLATLSKRPALTDLVRRDGDGTWNDHVALANWADLMLVAPATANTLSKMAHGLCDNLLLACHLSMPQEKEGRKVPVYVAPAMDLEMFASQAVQRVLDTLAAQGVRTIGPESGELASGLEGPGRMTEPDDIVKRLLQDLTDGSPLAGRRILVTAGPTHEPIDPVRFIGNRSTGKMGFAIAREAALRGAQVELVAGPVDIALDRPGVRRTDVTTAAEMAAAVKERFAHCDMAIMCAAVADARPSAASEGKIKKANMPDHIALEPTEDILAWMGANKRAGQVLVGFALETDDGMAEARGKLERKHLDLIVLNSLRDAGAGFGHDTNKVTMLDRSGAHEAHPLMDKKAVARALLDRLERIPAHA